LTFGTFGFAVPFFYLSLFRAIVDSNIFLLRNYDILDNARGEYKSGYQKGYSDGLEDAKQGIQDQVLN
jgi:hypothetical protein